MIPAHPAIIQIPSLHYEFPNSFPSMVSSCGAELAWGSWEVYEILLFASERCPCVSDKTEDESDYLCLLFINRNPVFFLHLQERHSGCCGTSPSWWNLLRPCCSVSCGQWLLLHKVVQCLIHAFSFVCRISPIYLKSAGEAPLILFKAQSEWECFTAHQGLFHNNLWAVRRLLTFLLNRKVSCCHQTSRSTSVWGVCILGNLCAPCHLGHEHAALDALHPSPLILEGSEKRAWP